MENLAAPQLPPVFFTAAAVEGARVVTDAGRAIPVFRHELTAVLPPGQQLSFQNEQQRRSFLTAVEQQFFANTKQNPQAVVRVADACPLSNCHGWIFTGGKYGVCDSHALSILDDNGYSVAPDIQEGDLIVFTNSGQVKHSGIARMDAAGRLLVESKWGPFGVYLHGLESHPFAKDYSCYRSSRAGHLLTILPAGDVTSEQRLRHACAD